VVVMVVKPDEAAGDRLTMIGRVWEVVKSYIVDAGRRRQRMLGEWKESVCGRRVLRAGQIVDVAGVCAREMTDNAERGQRRSSQARLSSYLLLLSMVPRQ
jgi:hypothetical protein